MMMICEDVFSIIVIFIIDLVYVHYVVVFRV